MLCKNAIDFCVFCLPDSCSNELIAQLLHVQDQQMASCAPSTAYTCNSTASSIKGQKLRPKQNIFDHLSVVEIKRINNFLLAFINGSVQFAITLGYIIHLISAEKKPQSKVCAYIWPVQLNLHSISFHLKWIKLISLCQRASKHMPQCFGSF